MWPTTVKFVIVNFLDNNNNYRMTPNFHFQFLYVACFEQFICDSRSDLKSLLASWSAATT